jgi:hypothetical protein
MLHMLIWLSRPPAANKRQSALKCTHATCWLCHRSSAKGCGFRACQILTLPSHPAVAAILPSGRTATSAIPGTVSDSCWLSASCPFGTFSLKHDRCSSALPLKPEVQLGPTARHITASLCSLVDARGWLGCRVSQSATVPSSEPATACSAQPCTT